MSMSYNYVPELGGRLERIWRPCCMLYVSGWMVLVLVVMSMSTFQFPGCS